MDDILHAQVVPISKTACLKARECINDVTSDIIHTFGEREINECIAPEASAYVRAAYDLLKKAAELIDGDLESHGNKLS